MRVTATVLKALRIVKEHGPIRPEGFARKMWPDSPRWTRMTRCGPKGATAGGGMRLAGGGYLGKLRQAGLIWHQHSTRLFPCKEGYFLTEKGECVLKEGKVEE